MISEAHVKTASYAAIIGAAMFTKRTSLLASKMLAAFLAGDLVYLVLARKLRADMLVHHLVCFPLLYKFITTDDENSAYRRVANNCLLGEEMALLSNLEKASGLFPKSPLWPLMQLIGILACRVPLFYSGAKELRENIKWPEGFFTGGVCYAVFSIVDIKWAFEFYRILVNRLEKSSTRAVAVGHAMMQSGIGPSA